MKILVTGAAGFIGFHTAKKLLERGDEVVGLDNLNEYYDVRLKHARLEILKRLPGFSFVRLDLADREGMSRLFAEQKFHRVINLAAQAGGRYSIQNPLVHNIRSTGDAASTVNTEHLQQTCQQCHPDATQNFPAGWLGHGTPDWNQSHVLAGVTSIYQVFVPAAFGGSLLYILLWM